VANVRELRLYSKRTFFHLSAPSDFTGTWVNKFPVEMTHNHNFRLNEREVVKVSMMQTKGNFLAANDQELDCDILQLEYVGGISMLIVVPRKLSGMKTLEAQLTPQVVERWQKSMTNRYFRSSVPLLSKGWGI
jgi:serine protease inhibitor